MAILIGQASSSENGGIYGNSGDQTGREINISNWYSFPWDTYIECNDAALANKAATYMEQIANDNNFGYSQANRWNGYNSIRSNGGKVSGAKGDFDCSSLVISCYALAGLPIITGSGYTGTIEATMRATGKFTIYKDNAHLTNSAYAKRGGIYLNTQHHVIMSLQDGNLASKTPAPIQQAVSQPTRMTFNPTLKAGTIVNFTGNTQYLTAMSVNGESVKGGKAKITFTANNSYHPYHLVGMDGCTVYGWVDTTCVEEIKEKPTQLYTNKAVYTVGEIVNFTGTKHYGSADSSAPISCKPGKAKITAIYENGKHPYHLIKTAGTSTVYGWVNAEDISK